MTFREWIFVDLPQEHRERVACQWDGENNRIYEQNTGSQVGLKHGLQIWDLLKLTLVGLRASNFVNK